MDASKEKDVAASKSGRVASILSSLPGKKPVKNVEKNTGKTPGEKQGTSNYNQTKSNVGKKNLPTAKRVEKINKKNEKETNAANSTGNKKSRGRRPNHNNGSAKLSIIPLGGLGEVGKNMTVFKYGNNIIVVDCGVMFPEEELLGIDLVVPDYTYLVENKEMVRGIFLTHGHEDHIGSLPYLLKALDVPVYGSRLTLGLLSVKLKEHHLNDVKLQEVKAHDTITAGPFKVEFIRLSHSIPDSMGMAIHTPIGTVLHVSDFKMDMNPIDGQMMDFGRIAALGEEGVLLLLADSTNAEREGYTASEKTVGDRFDTIFRNISGRIILTTFASNVHRIQQAIWAAEQNNRKVAVLGRSMENVTSIAREMGYLQCKKNTMIDIDQVKDYPDKHVLIITTGSQGEPMAGLARMAKGEHRQVQIKEGDTIVISASPIPGNEKSISRTIDNLYRLGANVMYERSLGIHVSGHASQEELKVLLTMVKPTFFVPIHGEYRMLYKHKCLAESVGIPANHIFVMENGQVLDINKKQGKISGTVPSGRILVDGLGVGDIGNSVLKDRKQLSEDGIVILTLIMDKDGRKIIAGPDIVSRGFIFAQDYEDWLKELKAKLEQQLNTYLQDSGEYDFNRLRNIMRETTSKQVFARTHRRPIILPIITTIS